MHPTDQQCLKCMYPSFDFHILDVYLYLVFAFRYLDVVEQMRVLCEIVIDAVHYVLWQSVYQTLCNVVTKSGVPQGIPTPRCSLALHASILAVRSVMQLVRFQDATAKLRVNDVHQRSRYAPEPLRTLHASLEQQCLLVFLGSRKVKHIVCIHARVSSLFLLIML